MRKLSLLTLTTALALGACNSTPTETLNEENTVVTENFMENANVAMPAPVENATNTTATAAPAPGFTDDQQMRDDADASGMTARLPDGSTGGDDTAPVQK